MVEIWDLLDDVGAAFRGLEAKTAAVRRQHPRDIVTGVLVLRGTHRNRTLVAGFRGLFRARLGGSSAMALRSLTDSTCPLPHADVLLWTDVAGTCVIASRLGAAAARDGVPSSGAVQRTTLRT